LIMMPEDSTEPLVTITVKLQEDPLENKEIIEENLPEPPTIFEPTYSGDVSGVYRIFESSQFGFSMEYPSEWTVDDEVLSEEGWDNIVGFTPTYDWTTSIIVGYGENDPSMVGLTGVSYLDQLSDGLGEWCSGATYDYDGFTCNNYAAMNTKEILLNGNRAYQIEYTFQKHLPEGYLIQIITRQVEIPSGTNVWQIYVDAPKSQWNDYKTGLIHGINTFETSRIIEPTTTQKTPSYIPDFVDPSKGAKYYLHRYYDEPAYKAWFDENYPDYTIEEAIELVIPDAFSDIEIVQESKQKIPDWVKNTFKWYVEGAISEDEMISAIQFLIKEGVIKI